MLSFNIKINVQNVSQIYPFVQRIGFFVHRQTASPSVTPSVFVMLSFSLRKRGELEILQDIRLQFIF